MDEKAIARLLITDWALGLRITTVPQAMHRLGIADDLERRWEIADRMDALWHSALKAPEKLQEVNLAIGRISEEEQAGLAESWPEQVASWDRPSILLTDNEKLIARQILYRQKASSNLPSPDDISAAVGIEPEETANGIKMLSWLGFLTLPDGEPADSYTLADGHARFLDGLGFSFHTVTLDDDEQFGIP